MSKRWEIYSHADPERRRVVAVAISGEQLLVGMARCHPDDCFDVNVGREIAVKRVIRQAEGLETVRTRC